MAHDILIVDDEVDIRDLVSGILSDEGYGARTAADSDSALAAIQVRLPSLIVLDIWLDGSELDGLELLSLAHGIDPDLPVIMITKNEEEWLMEEAIAAQISNYLTKPVNPSQILIA